ncbi:hypothetical protein FH972_019675 [Carpinus fangiana]|uniref:Uncharacterized protein n=1 Tax=Carpinus fangiana TaxID=176857 RepID=A0A5N6RSC8_9ROSI|nr:hypothetical protein FH972_019675 [Carpinus fangiana]
MKEVAMELESLRIMKKHPLEKVDLYTKETGYMLTKSAHSFSIDVGTSNYSTNSTAGYNRTAQGILAAAHLGSGMRWRWWGAVGLSWPVDRRLRKIDALHSRLMGYRKRQQMARGTRRFAVVKWAMTHWAISVAEPPARWDGAGSDPWIVAMGQG